MNHQTMKNPASTGGGPWLIAWLLAALCLATDAQALQRWLYCSQNLWVDQNVTDLEALLRRAAKAGYTHVLLSDSKFAKLGDMDVRYFNNVNRLKKVAAEIKLEIVPALFSVGYSNDLLWHNPNLIEALPVREAPLLVAGGVARLQGGAIAFPGGDFSNLAAWSWKDANVAADQGTARITNPNGQNARLAQTLKVQPFRQYHIAVRVKTQDFRGTPEVKILAGNQSLNFNNLGAQATQDWQTHHVVFNSLGFTNVTAYFGCWGGTTGTLWWDDAAIEEVAFLNLVRRDGAPLNITREDGTPLREGIDFTSLKDPRMGVLPWAGSYDIYHQPPLLQTTLPEGTRLRASYYHGVTIYDDQAMICPSEPQTIELLRDQARRMHAAWGAKGYFMSHDEIRVMNWCDACQKRQLGAGAMLADNVRTCLGILREVNPGGNIYVWSDMFDPNHNAHPNYYLVRGDLTGSWEGLDKNVIVVPWYFEQRAASLKFFADRGHRQLIAGYYDSPVDKLRDWLNSAKPYAGIQGAMYTTWQRQFSDLEKFSGIVNEFEPKLRAQRRDSHLELTLMSFTGGDLQIQNSADLRGWLAWATVNRAGSNTWQVNPLEQARNYFRASEP